MQGHKDYEVIETNAENIGGCGFCCYKSSRSGGYHGKSKWLKSRIGTVQIAASKNDGHHRKSNWLKERYGEGLKFKVLRSRKFGDIGMIEYALGNQAWRPVEAEGYLVIHCLMVKAKHQGKGLGSLLLDGCLRDAKKSKCRGVAVVTSSDSFMAGSDLFLKAGFVSVDRIPPYDLLVKKLKQTAPNPSFIVERERLCQRFRKGLTILAADQCPSVPKWVEEITEASRTLGLKPRVVRIESAEASRELPTPYGMFSIIYDGKLIAHRPISATSFLNIMTKHRGLSLPTYH
jgi:ribosomal protein S18 acetylase RimI-like enzyme